MIKRLRISERSRSSRLVWVLAVLLVVAVGGLLYYATKYNHVAHAGSTYTPLGNITLNNQTFYEEACVTSSTINTDTLAVVISVDRQDGPNATPPYNTTALHSVNGGTAVPSDNWNTASTSTITFDLSATPNATFNIGVESGTNGATATYGPSYRLSYVGPCSSSVTESSVSSCTPNPQEMEILENSCHLLLGAAVSGYPGVGSGILNQIAGEEARTNGAHVQVVHTYNSAGDDTLSPDELTAANYSKNNTYLYLNWKPSNNWADAGGSDSAVNSQIVTMAKSLMKVPNKVFLVIYHEPENNVSSLDSSAEWTNDGYSGFSCPKSFNPAKGANSGTPDQYKAMWANVESIFRSTYAKAGVANNIVWVMDYMGYSGWDCLVPSLWPVTSTNGVEVDWVTFDIYNDAGQSNSTFQSTVGPYYNYLTYLSSTKSGSPMVGIANKPWGAGEYGSGQIDLCDAHNYSEDPVEVDGYFNSVKTAINSNAFPNLHLYQIFDSPGASDGPKSCGYAVPGGFMGEGYTPWGVSWSSLVAANSKLDGGKYAGVQNPQAAYSAVANDKAFTIGNSTVSLLSVSPSSGPVTGGTALTLVGTDFKTGDSVTLGSTPAVVNSVSSDGTTITATTPPSTTVGKVDVTVSGDGQSSSLTNAFTYTAVTPTSPVVSSPSQTTTSINLTWTASTDGGGTIAGYDVYRDGTQLGSGSLTTTGTSYTDTGLTPGTSYTYTVVAVDSSGNDSLPSAPLVVSTITPPPAPTGLASPNQTTTSINLTWVEAADPSGTVTGYNVLRNGTQVGTSSSTSYTDTGLTSGKAYTYTLIAYDSNGNDSSASLPFTVSTITPPTAPTNLTATATSSTQVNLTWDASTDSSGTVAGYDIERDGTVIGQSTSTSYQDNTASADTSYSYTVIAYDTNGNPSSPSNTANVTTPPIHLPPPTAPTNVAAVAVSPTQVNLTWDASTSQAGISGYIIYRDGKLLATTKTDATNYGDDTVSPDTTYSYAVAGYNADGTSSQSSPAVKVTTPKPQTNPHGLTATYFDDPTLAFDSNSVTEIDPNIDFNWGSTAPKPGFPQYDWSIRWTGQITAPVTGTYTFYAATDDGERLWVNGQELINDWQDHWNKVVDSGNISLTAGQSYSFQMEYYEDKGVANAQLSWSAPGLSKQVIPESDFYAASDGFTGAYFDNQTLTPDNNTYSELDPAINFNWGSNPPKPGFPHNNWSAMWASEIVAPATGTYTFTASTDDGNRVWIDGSQITANWANHIASVPNSGTVNLVGNQPYYLKMDYYQGPGVSSAKLTWSGPSLPTTTNLF